MKHIILIAIILSLFSCEPYKHNHNNCKIHCYQTGSNDNNDLLWWYILYGNNNTYYVYSSPTQVSNFTSVNWESQTSMPQELANVEEVSAIETPMSELPDEIDVDMAETTEATEGNSGNESGSESGSSESSSSDGGSSGSDGGSSGGDSGGGGD